MPLYSYSIFAALILLRSDVVDLTCQTESYSTCLFPFVTSDNKLYYECNENRECATEVEIDTRKALKYETCQESCFNHSQYVENFCKSRSQNGLRCKFPFPFRGRLYEECTTMGTSESWCILEDGKTFSHCDESCPGYKTISPDACKTTDGLLCQFPFTYGNKIYYGCTLDGHVHPWCPTIINSLGQPEAIGNCSYTCDGYAMEMSRCRSVFGTACIFPFEYKGVIYKECAIVDHVLRWCSVYNLANGTMRNWGECLERTCIRTDKVEGEEEEGGSYWIISVILALSVLANISVCFIVGYRFRENYLKKYLITRARKSRQNDAQNSFVIEDEEDGTFY